VACSSGGLLSTSEGDAADVRVDFLGDLRVAREAVRSLGTGFALAARAMVVVLYSTSVAGGDGSGSISTDGLDGWDQDQPGLGEVSTSTIGGQMSMGENSHESESVSSVHPMGETNGSPENKGTVL